MPELNFSAERRLIRGCIIVAQLVLRQTRFIDNGLERGSRK
jgi:hypothetical protein